MVQAVERIREKIKVWTYDDFKQLPEYGSGNGPHIGYELLEGELVMSPAPLIQHQRIIGNLYEKLKIHVRQFDLGEVFIAPVDVVLDEHNTVEPDIVFVSRERRHIITAENIQGAPDLVVEVVSPFSSRRDRVRKFEIYARFGIPFYWIVDPQFQTIDEYALNGDTYRLVREWAANEEFQPQYFAGLAIPLAEIFTS